MGVEFKCVTVTNTVLMPVLESKKDSLDVNVGSVFSPLCMLVGESLPLSLHTSVWVY